MEASSASLAPSAGDDNSSKKRVTFESSLLPIAAGNNGPPAQQAYQYFANADMDVSGQLQARHLIRLLVDADTEIEGGNEAVTYPQEFPEADCGLVYEEVKEFGETLVRIKSIEEESPASKNSHVMVGLRVAYINQNPIACLGDVTWALKHAPSGSPLTIRFREPAFVVTKYNNALDMSIKIPRRARSRDGSGVGYGIRRGGKKGAVAAKILDQRHTQPQHKVVTVELEIGAYSGAEDLATMVQRCIHAAIENARLTIAEQFNVEVEPKHHDFVIHADKAPFSLLFRRAAHSLLGFRHEDTKEHKIHKGRRRKIEGLDLSFLEQSQVEELAQKIMARYDTSKDSVMVFEEFVQFYKEFIETPAKVVAFRHWIKEQFLSEAEIRRRAERAAEEAAREQRRSEIMALREKNHQIRQEQWRAIKAQAVKEHDGQFRRRKQSLASPPAPLAPVALVPAKAAQEGEGVADADDLEEEEPPAATKKELSLRGVKRLKAKAIKRKQRELVQGLWRQLHEQHKTEVDNKIQRLAELDKQLIRLTKQYGSDIVAIEKPKFTHPCFFGYTTFRRKPFDIQTTNPLFAGQLSCQVRRSRTSKYTGIRDVMRDQARGMDDFDNHVWKHFPAPRTSTLYIRAKVRSDIPECYDDQMIIHPACFGQMLCTVTKDPALIHPSMIGFTLEKKPPVDANSRALLLKIIQETSMALTCEVCLVGKPGCPNCWSYPSGFQSDNFEYNGQPLNDRYPPFHTRLTTERAIYWYRKQQCRYLTLVVKSLPYGEVTVLQVDVHDPISHLYHLHRINSKHGNEPCSLYIPHTKGVFALDNTFIPASDLCNEVDTGQEPLTHYNLGNLPAGSRLVVLHLTIEHEEHILGNIAQYLAMTMHVHLPPGWRIRYEYDYLPSTYLDDPIQQYLTHIIDMQIENARKVKENPSLMEPPQDKHNKKGTVMEVSDEMRQDMQQRRVERMHEMDKLLNVGGIVLTDGNKEGEVELRRTSMNTAIGLLRRQRFHKTGAGEHKGEGQEGGRVENAFMELAAAASGLRAGGRPEDEYIDAEAVDDLLAYR